MTSAVCVPPRQRAPYRERAAPCMTTRHGQQLAEHRYVCCQRVLPSSVPVCRGTQGRLRREGRRHLVCLQCGRARPAPTHVSISLIHNRLCMWRVSFLKKNNNNCQDLHYPWREFSFRCFYQKQLTISTPVRRKRNSYAMHIAMLCRL